MGKYGWRRVLSIVCAGAMAVLMAGCGQKTTAEGEEKAEISILDFFAPSEGMTKAIKPLVEQYLAEHPNIVLDEESASSADLAIKIQALAAGGELPDVFMLKGQMVQAFVESGKSYTLNDMLDADTEWKGDFKEGVFFNSTINEKIYVLPFQATNTCASYNTELLAQTGIAEFPKTWGEPVGIIPDLEALGVAPIVLGNREKWNMEPATIGTPGNRAIRDDQYQSIHDSSGAKFTDPGFMVSLQALSDLVEVGVFNEDVNSIDGMQQRRMYVNGKAVITIDGNQVIANFDENCPDEVRNVIEMAALLMVEGGRGGPGAITGEAGWMITVSAKIMPEKLVVVTDVLKAMTGPAYGTVAIKEGTLTAVKPGENMEIASTITAKFNQFAEGRPSTPVCNHQLSSGVIGMIQDGLQELLIGRVVPEELA